MKRDNWWAQYLLFGAALGAVLILLANIVLSIYFQKMYETEARLIAAQGIRVGAEVQWLNAYTEEGKQ